MQEQPRGWAGQGNTEGKARAGHSSAEGRAEQGLGGAEQGLGRAGAWQDSAGWAGRAARAVPGQRWGSAGRLCGLRKCNAGQRRGLAGRAWAGHGSAGSARLGQELGRAKQGFGRVELESETPQQ